MRDPDPEVRVENLRSIRERRRRHRNVGEISHRPFVGNRAIRVDADIRLLDDPLGASVRARGLDQTEDDDGGQESQEKPAAAATSHAYLLFFPFAL
jgi:hypothetical protein